MFGFIFAIFMALACPAHNQNNGTDNGGTVTSQDTDTGGDGAHIPPPPPPPKP